VKTTLEIADATLHQAKIAAAQQGITLKELFNQALEEKLQRPTQAGRKAKPAWLKLEGAFGKTAAARAETRRIQEAIDAEFERIELEDLTQCSSSPPIWFACFE
jgi:hypothetical protein